MLARHVSTSPLEEKRRGPSISDHRMPGPRGTAAHRLLADAYLGSGATDPTMSFLRGVEKGTERLLAITNAMVTPASMGLLDMLRP